MVDVDQRDKVIQRLKTRSAYARSRVKQPLRLVVASRPLAILDEMPDAEVQHFVLQPFSSAQLEQFASNWFASEGDDGVKASNFVAELKASRIEGLAAVPALATLAAVVFERSADGSLPRRRSELYDQFIELVCEERDEEAWQSFVDVCETAYRGRGEQIASNLWAARE